MEPCVLDVVRPFCLMFTLSYVLYQHDLPQDVLLKRGVDVRKVDCLSDCSLPFGPCSRHQFQSGLKRRRRQRPGLEMHRGL